MAFGNVGQICDLVEVMAGQAGVHKSKINRRLLWDLVSLKGIDVARRSGVLSGVSTFVTTADVDLYEKPSSASYIREVKVEEVPAIKTTRGDVLRLRDSNSGTTVSQDTVTSWLYWQENRGRNGYIGICDAFGTAPQTADLDIEIYYSTFPDIIESDDDTIGLPAEFMLPFAQGLAAEVMRLNGIVNNLTQIYDAAWQKMEYDMIHKAVDNEAQTLIQYPLTLVCD